MADRIKLAAKLTNMTRVNDHAVMTFQVAPGSMADRFELGGTYELEFELASHPEVPAED